MYSFAKGEYYNIPGFHRPMRFEFQNASTGELVFLHVSDGTLRYFHVDELDYGRVSHAVHTAE